MLLVKQNVLKSYGKIYSALICAVITCPSYAKETSSTDFLRMLMSLIIVLTIILLLAYLVKKLKITPNSQKYIHTVASLSVGTKERVVIVEVNNKQFMLGVTSNNVNLLHELDEKISVNDLKDKMPFTIQSLFNKGKP